MNFYLKKYGFRPPFLTQQPSLNLGLIVAIPCFNEPDILPMLNALLSAEQPQQCVEVIVIINAGVQTNTIIKKQNLLTKNQVEEFASQHNTDKLTFHTIYVDDLPKKHAGVGLARKIGMDEAVHRFDLLQKDGIIVCFDADSLCSKNYLTAIEQHFKANPKTPGCSIYFEHPLNGKEFDKEVYTGIVNYELHLRYYKLALKYANLPYAFHTVGSSMAVRSSAYQKQGGMNKRKAGEDFYFIHKIIGLGQFTELKNAKVIPSPRVSDRVPFGTGKAIGDWIAAGEQPYYTYNFESFELIKTFVEHIPALRTKAITALNVNATTQGWTRLIAFLAANNFNSALNEIRNNSTTDAAFSKRFFQWFDAFRVLKLVHFLRDSQFSNVLLTDAVNLLLTKSGLSEETSVLDQLKVLRVFEAE